MTAKVFLKPVDNRIVRDPETGTPLPVEGAEKTMNSFWLRRLNDGDVVKAKPIKPTNKDKG